MLLKNNGVLPFKNGKKVAICEQLSAVGDQKGMVKRDVVRVITPGTVTDDEILDATANCYLLSLCCNKKGGIGMAWADISTGEVYVKELVDSSNLEDVVLSIAPSEIITDTEVYTEFNEQFEFIAWIAFILLVIEALILTGKSRFTRGFKLFDK